MKIETDNQKLYTSIKILSIALTIGALFPTLAIALIATNFDGAPISLTPLLGNLFFIIVNTIAIGVVLIGFKIFNKKKENFSTMQTLNEKLNHYRNIMLIRLAPIEFSAIIFSIAYLLKFDINYFYEAIICIALLAYYYPSLTRIANEMNVEIGSLDDL